MPGATKPGAGRPKRSTRTTKKKSISEIAKEYGPRAIEVLLEVAEDKSATPSSRVTAANYLLDRGFGKPTTSTDVNVTASDISTILADLPDGDS